MSDSSTNSRSPWPHRMAWMLLCATLTLIVAGGIVTTTDSGMAFRDWLTSDGTFFLGYNWFASEGDKFIEHGHRLLGALAGFLSIGLVASCFVAERRPWVRKFSLVILAGVILQGILGGARVVFDERMLALVHGCTGPLFFVMTAAMVVFTSRWWQQVEAVRPSADNAMPRKTFRLAIICVLITYLQIAVGAVVRHSPDLTGQLTATIFQVAVYFHIFLALMILGHVLMLAVRCLRTGLQRIGGVALLVLVAAQISLGMATWVVKYGMPLWASQYIEWSAVNRKSDVTSSAIITSHMVIGSLIFIVSTIIAIRLGRQLRVMLPKLPTSEARMAEVAR